MWASTSSTVRSGYRGATAGPGASERGSFVKMAMPAVYATGRYGRERRTGTYVRYFFFRYS